MLPQALQHQRQQAVLNNMNRLLADMFVLLQTTLGPDGHTLVPLNPYNGVNVLTGRWPNMDAAAVLRPHIPYVNTWNLTSMLWNFHRCAPAFCLLACNSRLCIACGWRVA